MRLLLLMIIGLGFGFTCEAGDDDPVTAKLEKAKLLFESRSEAVTKLALAELEANEKNARKRGQNALVDQILAERAAFVKDELTPPSLSIRIRREVANNYERLEDAYQDASKAYLAQMKDDLRKKCEDEFAKVAKRYAEQNAKTLMLGRFLITCDPPIDRRAIYTFADNGTVSEDGRQIGEWIWGKDNITVKYSDRAIGIATINFVDQNQLVGSNTHANGATWKWHLARQQQKKK